MALNQRPEGGASVPLDPPIMAVARRYWWVSALVLLLVALVGGARYLTAPQTYVATQDLSVALIPAPALSNPGDAALAMSGAQAVAHAIASSDTITTTAFADAVLTRLPADTVRQEGVTTASIQKALTATNQEAQVQVQASWSTAAGARAIVSAAALALQASPQIPAYALNPGDTVSVQLASSAPVVEQDPQRQSENFNALIQQLVIGLGIALLLPWVFAGLTRVRRGGVAPTAGQESPHGGAYLP
jgi:hypothetical protein